MNAFDSRGTAQVSVQTQDSELLVLLRAENYPKQSTCTQSTHCDPKPLAEAESCAGVSKLIQTIVKAIEEPPWRANRNRTHELKVQVNNLGISRGTVTLN